MRSPPNLVEWERTVEAVEHPKDEVTIAIVGKYVEHKDAYKSLGEALRHGGIEAGDARQPATGSNPRTSKRAARTMLDDVDGILVPGGFGKRGFEGKIAAAKYARETWHSVFRHLLRHARGGDRFRAQHRRPAGRRIPPRTTATAPIR